MYLVPEEAIRGRRQSGGNVFPHAVDLLCPLCRKDVAFVLTLEGQHTVGLPKGIPCPRCVGEVTFINLPNVGLFVHPDPVQREPIRLEDVAGLSEQLRALYASAIRIYSMGEWRAAATLCRTVLEGITESLLPPTDRKVVLAQRLQQLPEAVDLGEPVREIADVLRKGGNLAAHFDMEREPDAVTTTEMVDLMDYLIE
jgi:hypothetical protein